MNFEEYSNKPENTDLLNHLDNLGFKKTKRERFGEPVIVWDFFDIDGNVLNALIYLEGRVLYLGGLGCLCTVPNNGGDINTIQEANDMFHAFKLWVKIKE